MIYFESKTGLEPANLLLGKQTIYQLIYFDVAEAPGTLPGVSCPHIVCRIRLELIIPYSVSNRNQFADITT